MTTEPQLIALMGPVLRLVQAHGFTAIDRLPGAAEIEIDAQWYLAVNGHDSEIEVSAPGRMPATIPPYNFAVWYNGWLAGLFHPFDGSFAAGSAANEKEFCAAIETYLKDRSNP